MKKIERARRAREKRHYRDMEIKYIKEKKVN